MVLVAKLHKALGIEESIGASRGWSKAYVPMFASSCEIQHRDGPFLSTMLSLEDVPLGRKLTVMHRVPLSIDIF